MLHVIICNILKKTTKKLMVRQHQTHSRIYQETVKHKQAPATIFHTNMSIMLSQLHVPSH